MVFFEQNNENAQNNETNGQDNKLDNCLNELKSAKESFLRISADFENYQRRISKEKVSWMTNAQIDIFNDLLPIIDDFDRAFVDYKKGQNLEADKWIQGFELIYKAFQKFLIKFNISEITEINEFDPELHEAIAQVDSSDKKSGQIVSIVQKGYKIKDQVLRPAKVTVSK